MAVDSVAELTTPKALHLRPESAASPDLDRDSFMKLLVAELKHQDPLDPLKAREMITQLSTLTSVEKLISIEEGITAVREETAAVASSNVTSMVGRTATADASSLVLSGNGVAGGSFQIPSRAEEVEVAIRNPSGELVRTLSLGDTFPGNHAFAWDGNDEAGNPMPVGRYGIAVSAKSPEGNPVPASTTISGMVTEISYENGAPEVVIGDTRVLLGDVTSIAQ